MIKGVQVIELSTFEDDRGYLIEIVRRSDDPDPHGVVDRFGQVYMSGSPARGTIRGFHKHLEMWDWFFINLGSAKFVLVDDRESSPTYAEQMTLILSARIPRLLVLPPGIHHGWMSLEDNTQMICTTSHPYNRESPDEVRIPADSYGDVWSVKAR